MEYTVIGDTVNTASRIESLCKSYDTDLLISGSSAVLLKGTDIKLKFVDEAAVRGKTEKVKLYTS
jgi:adenylate cyclase